MNFGERNESARDWAFCVTSQVVQRSKNDLHWDKKRADFRSVESAGKNDDEYEANQFAAELLMPEDLLRDFVKRERVDLSNDIDISRLAGALQVSKRALTIRLIILKMVKSRIESSDTLVATLQE